MDKLTPYTYYATVTSVHDGDTFTVDIDLGLDTWRKAVNVRLNGCNAIELKDPGGKEAQANLAGKLPVGTVILLQSVNYDKYGSRVDADVWFIDHAGNALTNGSLTALLVAGGWAAAWNGKGAKPVPAWPRVVPASTAKSSAPTSHG